MSMPLFDPRSARFSRSLLCALESHCIVGMQTLGPLYQKIVDSMWKLYTEGLFIKAKGRKVKFCTVEIRGDWEWHSVAFDFIPTWRSDQFCWRCEADKKKDPNYPFVGLFHSLFLPEMGHQRSSIGCLNCHQCLWWSNRWLGL